MGSTGFEVGGSQLVRTLVKLSRAISVKGLNPGESMLWFE